MSSYVPSIKDRKGGSWSTFRTAVGLIDPEANTADTDEDLSPRSNQKERNLYPLFLGDEIPVVTCNACSRPVLQTSLLAHLGICPGAEGLISKKIKTDPGNADHILLPIIAASDLHKPEKTKGINLDEHCGVTTDGIVCVRAITCKKHSVIAKRGVHGRSKPYDVLAVKFANAQQKAPNNGKLKQAIPNKLQRSKNGIPDMVTSEDEAQYIFDSIKYHIPQPIAPFGYHKSKR